MYSDTREWVESFVKGTKLEDVVGPPDWIVKPLLMPGTYSIIHGRQGAGKTRFLYQLAHSVQTGEPFFGMEVEKTGRVLMLQSDMSPGENVEALRGARATGLETDGIIVPSTWGFINVLEKDGQEALEALRDAFDPLVVYAETATELYRTPPKSADVNEVIQDVTRVFRKTFPAAGIGLSLHNRKKSPYLQAKGEEDEDAALGGGEWGRKASSIVRLTDNNDDTVTIKIEKARAKKPWKQIRLRRNEHGYMYIDYNDTISPTQALVLWPGIPGVDPEEATRVNSVSGVCRSIETATGGRLKFDTLRKSYQRNKKAGVSHLWEPQIVSD